MIAGAELGFAKIFQGLACQNFFHKGVEYWSGNHRTWLSFDDCVVTVARPYAGGD